MIKNLTRHGNSYALIIDRAILELLKLTPESPLELSTDGDVLVVSPIRERKRRAKVKELVAEAHEQYGGVFKRLAE